MYKSHPSDKFNRMIQKEDLKASREMEGQRVPWETTEPQLSLGARFRKFFMGR